MQPDICAGFFMSLLFLLAGLKMLLSGLVPFRGFAEGFWAAVFNRLIVGSRQPPEGRALFGCLLLAVLSLLLVGCVGPILMVLLVGLSGTVPVR